MMTNRQHKWNIIELWIEKLKKLPGKVIPKKVQDYIHYYYGYRVLRYQCSCFVPQVSYSSRMNSRASTYLHKYHMRWSPETPWFSLSMGNKIFKNYQVRR